MNKTFKNFLKGICNTYQGMCDILTFGTTAGLSCGENEQDGKTNLCAAQRKNKNRFDDVNSRFKSPSLQQRHNKILRDLQMFENDFRNLFGPESHTLGSVNLNGQPGIKINSRPIATDYRIHAIKTRQRQ